MWGETSLSILAFAAYRFTVNQVRDRLDLLSPILNEGFHRGTRGKILVQDNVLAALRRMCEIEREGLSPKEAQSQILQQLGNGAGKRLAKLGEGDGKLIEALEREIKRLEGEVASLRTQVDLLTPLAFPGPRRRWFAWLLPARGR